MFFFLSHIFASNDVGHIFGHGGVSHGDHGHPPYTNVGEFGGEMAHHNGAATHHGDTGKNNVLFTNDVLHHGDGGVYVNVGPTANVHPAISLDDIHHKMSDAAADAHNASIAGKEAARKAELLQASIADERAKQKEEELAVLKEMDDEAAKQEHMRPEVLGKETVPVANFTQESFPLFHHVRDLLGKIKAIEATEEKAIQAQETITRLDDITDQVRLQDVSMENPHAYHTFLAAGNADAFRFHIPVVDQGGKFYISPFSIDNTHGTHGVPMREKRFPDGHSHYVDHGDITNPDLESGGRVIGSRKV